jgi:salicylate 1-O-methyltransferase
MPSLSESVAPEYGLMKGDGFYNRHAWVQAAGIGAALPLLARAAAAVPVEPPVVVADYGSSQGRNSLRPMGIAIGCLRDRAPDVPITVVHVDQPGNDFASLFTLLSNSDESYLRRDPEIYAAAVGRSFFNPVLPPGSVTLGWSSFAAMWLTRVPPNAAGHVVPYLAPPDVRSQVLTQGASDWQRFLAARGRELRPGGRIVVLCAGPAEQDSESSGPLHRIVAAALRQFVDEGRLPAVIRARAFVPTLPRRGEDMRAPFADGPFAGLVLEEHDDRMDLPDTAWERYCRDGDAEALADSYVGFFQATFLPSLLHSMEPFESAAQRDAVIDGLGSALREAIQAKPHRCAQIPMHTVLLRRL